jgi:hypothetical protein
VSPLSFIAKHSEILDEIGENAGTAILKDPKFDEWIEGIGSKSKVKTLWCHGIRE